MAAQFLYTEETDYQDATLARDAVLGMGYADLTDYFPNGVPRSFQLAPNSVLFAIGETKDLTDAFQRAQAAGLAAIEAEARQDYLAVLYVRTETRNPDSRIGLKHTVTLLSVAPKSYWGGARPGRPWANAQQGLSTARSLDEFLDEYIPNAKGVKAFA